MGGPDSEGEWTCAHPPAQQEGSRSGPLSGGWTRPGLCFRILPISDLAEGWGCRGPWPLPHTPPMTGSSLRRKLDSSCAALGSYLLDVRCPAGECAYGRCKASGHLVGDRTGLSGPYSGRPRTDALQGRPVAGRQSASFPPTTAPEVSPLPRGGEPCYSAWWGRKRRGHVPS